MTATRVLQDSIEKNFSLLGSHTFEVQKYPLMITVGGSGSQSRPNVRYRKNLTVGQGLRVAHEADLAHAIAIEQRLITQGVSAGKHRVSSFIFLYGVTAESFAARNWRVHEGRSFDHAEVTFGSNVAVLGSEIAVQLFPDQDPLGQTIRIDQVRFHVIGVLDAQQGLFSRIAVIIPRVTFEKIYGKNRSIHIVVQPSSSKLFGDAVEQVRGILRAARKVWPGSDDDFAILSSDILIKRFNELTFYIRFGIGCISFIALLTAGVGIMNIVLASVTERTNEIGVRRAVGARRRNILMQFTLEAVILSGIGGVVGILLGILAGNLVAAQLVDTVSIPFDWVFIGFASCLLVGVMFGVYPAWKAANLDPVDALRYENV
jgi:putative ABC transport system permease protein